MTTPQATLPPPPTPAKTTTLSNDDPVRSSWDTTKLFLIKHHYEEQSEYLHWTTNRYRRLCAALKMTEVELGAFIRIPPHQVTKCIRTNRFAPTVELHLTLIERSVFFTNHPPVFPALPP